MSDFINKEILEKTHGTKPYAVFLDIDGTMVCPLSQGRVSERLSSAIDKAKQKGHMFFVNSGRGAGFVPHALLESADFDGVVSGMGSHITYHGKTVYCSPLPEKIMSNVLTYCKEHGESIIFEGVPNKAGHDGRFCFGDSSFFEVAATFDDSEKLLCAISEHIPTKMTTPYYPSEEYAAYLSKYFEMVYMPPLYSEGALIGNNKGVAINKVCDYLSLPYENTVAVGDSQNDLGMLCSAGISVAMGNAPDVVKEKCALVCDSVENDGAAKLIEQLFL